MFLMNVDYICCQIRMFVMNDEHTAASEATAITKGNYDNGTVFTFPFDT